MWKRVVVVVVVLTLTGGVWAGFREMRRDKCFGGTGVESADDYNSLTLAEAEARAERDNQVVRVLGQDGKCADQTSDLRTDRVSLYLEDGEVVEARRS